MGNNYSSVQDLEERNLSAMSVANWGQKWVDFSFEGSFLFSCTSVRNTEIIKILVAVYNLPAKGQIKPKAGLARRRFSQKTNERI